MALDHTDRVLSLAVLDIVPTHAMFMETDRALASAYWHWYFLAQPEPFPERLIGADPDYFYETCLTGWGAATLEDFDAQMLASYRRTWRDPAAIHGSCSDYRAAASVDLQHDSADLAVKVHTPTLVYFGSKGVMARLFDLPAQWRRRCSRVTEASSPGGHFFVDQFPDETASTLRDFLTANVAPGPRSTFPGSA
jgi:haloacetate dehalogenase